MKILIALMVLSLTATVVLASFPGSVTRCLSGDNNCISKSSQNVLNAHWSGLRDLNLLPFDPLHIKSLVLPRNPSSPVNIELKFKDLDVHGLKTAKVIGVKGLEFKKRSILEIIVPQLSLKGNYNADGRVLILPIVGNGPSEIICTNIKLRYSFDLKPVQKEGKIFAVIDHDKLDIKPELVQFQFDNLFNGDKALGDNMNVFLNDNWRDIFQELKPGFAEALSLVAKQMFNNVFAKYPFEEFFV